MSRRSVSVMQTRAKCERLYIRYRSDVLSNANVLSYLKNDQDDEFIGEVINDLPWENVR